MDIISDSVVDVDADDDEEDFTFDLADGKSTSARSWGPEKTSRSKEHSFKTQPLRRKLHPKTPPNTFKAANAPGEDLTDIVTMLRSLSAELKYYETVCGRQSKN